MPDDTNPKTRFVTEEVKEEVTPPPAGGPAPIQPAGAEEPVTSYGEPNPPQHIISHTTTKFSAGVDTNNLFPSSLADKPQKSSSMGLVLLTVVLLAAAVGIVGFIFYKRGQSTPEAAPIQPVTSELASPSPEASASPSAQVVFDRATLKVKVQNGSGITGLASKAKTYLEGLGYADVKTANAASSDFVDTEVAVKEAFQSISTKIVDDLKDKYTVSSNVGTLDANEDFDVVITLGKN